MNKTNFYLLSFVVSAIGFSFHLIRLLVTWDIVHFLCMSLWGVIVYCLFFIMKVELGIPKKDQFVFVCTYRPSSEMVGVLYLGEPRPSLSMGDFLWQSLFRTIINFIIFYMVCCILNKNVYLYIHNNKGDRFTEHKLLWVLYL